MITTYTSTTNAPKTLTLDDIQKAVDQVEAFKVGTDWILGAPDGRVWKGNPEQLLQVLMPYHPLLKPMSLKDLGL